MTKIQTPQEIRTINISYWMLEFTKLYKLPHWSSNKDGKGKSSRGPDKIEYNNGVTATICPS